MISCLRSNILFEIGLDDIWAQNLLSAPSTSGFGES